MPNGININLDEDVTVNNINLDEGVETEVSIPGWRKKAPKIQVKPVNAEEAINSVFSIREGINENDPDVIASIAEKYFSLQNFEREKKPFPMAGTPLFDLRKDRDKYVNSLETDLKNYFKNIDKQGDFSKYEQYIEYQETIKPFKKMQKLQRSNYHLRFLGKTKVIGHIDIPKH